MLMVYTGQQTKPFCPSYDRVLKRAQVKTKADYSPRYRGKTKVPDTIGNCQ